MLEYRPAEVLDRVCHEATVEVEAAVLLDATRQVNAHGLVAVVVDEAERAAEGIVHRVEQSGGRVVDIADAVRDGAADAGSKLPGVLQHHPPACRVVPVL